MARKAPDFPTRILAIAVVIAVLLALLVWLLSGLGTPAAAPPPPSEEDVVEVQPPVPEGQESPVEGPLPDASPELLPPGVGGEPLTLQLYLVDGASRKLVPRLRRIDAPYPLATQAQMALDALVNAGEPGYSSPLPAETVIREVWVASGTAYVDLARNLPELLGGGSLTEIHAVYSIVGTLTGTFPEILQVQILVDGRSRDTLNGHLDVSRPLVPLGDWLY